MTLHPIFSDGLILQAHQPIRIFGEGGGKVTASFCGITVEKEFCGTKWILELAPLDYGGPYQMNITMDGRTVVLNDIFIGDVYLISGQSNMQFKTKELNDTSDYENNPRLRLFSTTRVSGGERFTPEDGWVNATKDTVGDFSAIGYLFGKELQHKTGHAIGLVSLCQGAAAIQCFLPPYVFQQTPTLDVPFEKRYDMQYSWNRHPSILFEFALTKIAPFSFGAVVWYQGESNCSEAESYLYFDYLQNLIISWRKELCTDDLPFVVVQIHDYTPRDTEHWHRIQKAQETIAEKIPLVKTVFTKDVCEHDRIHPLKKQEVSHRVALALSKFEDRKTVSG